MARLNSPGQAHDRAKASGAPRTNRPTGPAARRTKAPEPSTSIEATVTRCRPPVRSARTPSSRRTPMLAAAAEEDSRPAALSVSPASTPELTRKAPEDARRGRGEGAPDGEGHGDRSRGVGRRRQRVGDLQRCGQRLGRRQGQGGRDGEHRRRDEGPAPTHGESDGGHGEAPEQDPRRDGRLLHPEGEPETGHGYGPGQVEVGGGLDQGVGHPRHGQQHEEHDVAATQDGHGQEDRRRAQGPDPQGQDRPHPLRDAAQTDRGDRRPQEEDGAQQSEAGLGEVQVAPDLHGQGADQEGREHP